MLQRRRRRRRVIDVLAVALHGHMASLCRVHHRLAAGVDQDPGFGSNRHAHGQLHVYAFFPTHIRRVDAGARPREAATATRGVGVPVSAAGRVDGDDRGTDNRGAEARHEKTSTGRSRPLGASAIGRRLKKSSNQLESRIK